MSNQCLNEEKYFEGDSSLLGEVEVWVTISSICGRSISMTYKRLDYSFLFLSSLLTVVTEVVGTLPSVGESPHPVSDMVSQGIITNGTIISINSSIL